MGANHWSTRQSLKARIITRLIMRSGPSFRTWPEKPNPVWTKQSGEDTPADMFLTRSCT